MASLLRQRVPVNAAEPDGSTALHWAARLGRVDIVQALLRAKADVNVANRCAITPLTLAAINGSAEVVDLLLKAGADPNTTGADGETVLMLAACTGRRGGSVAHRERRERQRKRSLARRDGVDVGCGRGSR